MTAALGIAEIVDETMANAARVHAVENGKDIAGAHADRVRRRGAAACRAAGGEAGDRTVLIPRGAGVGSAIGFLRAPVGVRGRAQPFMRVSGFDAALVNDLFAEMEAEAEGVVRLGAPDADVTQVRTAYMRYAARAMKSPCRCRCAASHADDARAVSRAFEAAYTALFGRTIPKLDMEVVSWTLRATASAARNRRPRRSPRTAPHRAPSGTRRSMTERRACCPTCRSIAAPISRPARGSRDRR